MFRNLLPNQGPLPTQEAGAGGECAGQEHGQGGGAPQHLPDSVVGGEVVLQGGEGGQEGGGGGAGQTTELIPLGGWHSEEGTISNYRSFVGTPLATLFTIETGIFLKQIMVS